MLSRTKSLWNLVQSRQFIDAADLFAALEAQVQHRPLDFRTRLLIRDSLNALASRWGQDRLRECLAASAAGEQLEATWHQDLGRVGFPYLRDQIVETTKPDTIRQFFRELAGQIHKPVNLYVGGSAALILPELISRITQDIDVVDEVPAEIRSLRKSLEELTRRYRLELTHFQSHYLPRGWENRVHSQEPFGKLQVYLVDVYDVFLSKLFSAREKDRDDLRVLAPQLDRQILIRRLQETTADFRADQKMLKNAEDNWYIVFGESLPHDPDIPTGQGTTGRPCA